MPRCDAPNALRSVGIREMPAEKELESLTLELQTGGNSRVRIVDRNFASPTYLSPSPRANFQRALAQILPSLRAVIKERGGRPRDASLAAGHFLLIRFSIAIPRTRLENMTLLVANPKHQTEVCDIEFHWLEEAHHSADETDDPKFVVDLAAIDTICSEDLNGLIRLQSRLRSAGRTLILKNVRENLWQVFNVTRLNRLIAMTKYKIV